MFYSVINTPLFQKQGICLLVLQLVLGVCSALWGGHMWSIVCMRCIAHPFTLLLFLSRLRHCKILWEWNVLKPSLHKLLRLSKMQLPGNSGLQKQIFSVYFTLVDIKVVVYIYWRFEHKWRPHALYWWLMSDPGLVEPLASPVATTFTFQTI